MRVEYGPTHLRLRVNHGVEAHSLTVLVHLESLATRTARISMEQVCITHRSGSFYRCDMILGEVHVDTFLEDIMAKLGWKDAVRTGNTRCTALQSPCCIRLRTAAHDSIFRQVSLTASAVHLTPGPSTLGRINDWDWDSSTGTGIYHHVSFPLPHL